MVTTCILVNVLPILHSTVTYLSQIIIQVQLNIDVWNDGGLIMHLLTCYLYVSKLFFIPLLYLW
jgi:hypothetical protein